MLGGVHGKPMAKPMLLQQLPFSFPCLDYLVIPLCPLTIEEDTGFHVAPNVVEERLGGWGRGNTP